jgi:CDP-diacylglycerol--serine O-phosphatidyltransferase
MVTSGVVPGIIMFNLLSNKSNFGPIIDQSETILWQGIQFEPVQFLGLLLTLGACYRLAKFNIDERQSDSFIGLPTPAMCLVVISLPLIFEYSNFEFVQNLISNKYLLIVLTIILTYLMNAEMPLFSLKFKEYSLSNNWIKYLFLVISLLFIITLQYLSIPLIILLYVLISMITNYGKKTAI